MSVLPDDWALPALDDLNRAWFTSRSLAVQRCTGCGARQHPPEEICHACGAMAFDHDVLAPTGTVVSHTVAHYAVHRALAEHVPYAVVLVALDDAPEVRVIGNLPGTSLEDVRVGLPVEAFWEERTAEDGTTVHLPQWQPR